MVLRLREIGTDVQLRSAPHPVLGKMKPVRNLFNGCATQLRLEQCNERCAIDLSDKTNTHSGRHLLGKVLRGCTDEALETVLRRGCS